MMTGISVIISFYNKFEALGLALRSLELQKFTDFEVIIADDGSSQDNVTRLKELIDRSSLNIHHEWHEDLGWRKNIILNRAVQQSSNEYLFFMDGDCLLHPRCLEEHFKSRRKGWVSAGRRVDLYPEIAGRLSVSNLEKLWKRWIVSIARSSLKHPDVHFENAVFIRNRLIRSLINKKDKGILGSHFSIFKSDLMDVNGFDERFNLPAGGEDTDLEYRLRRNGMGIQTLKHIAIQYHLWHQPLPREESRVEIIEENNKGGVTYTPHGIIKDRK